MLDLLSLKKLRAILVNPDPESLELSLDDVHHPGLFSLVVGGTEAGKLTRIFIADTGIPIGAVQLHQHRYGIRLTTLKGLVVQHEAVRCDPGVGGAVRLNIFKYKSPLNGGDGLTYSGNDLFTLRMFPVPICGSLEMYHTEFHTISCGSGAMWMVEELGFKSDSSAVLGVPFDTDGLYTKVSAGRVDTQRIHVLRVVENLIKKFESL